jgi:DNA-binding transcriptional LysR family regulator
MTRVATYLNISPSAVSKRIHGLEQRYGRAVIERKGRHVQLTEFGFRLLAVTDSAILELKEMLATETSSSEGRLVIAMSGAIMLSWGANTLKAIREENPGIDFWISTYRAPVAIEHVRSGNSMVALAHGLSEDTPDLAAQHVVDEQFVIVPSALKPFRFPKDGILELLGIHKSSETWTFLNRMLAQNTSTWKIRIEMHSRMQNFMGVCQMARAGFGHGIVPLGVPLALGIPREKLVMFPNPGIKVPVSLIGRQTMLQSNLVTAFLQALKRHLPADI